MSQAITTSFNNKDNGHDLEETVIILDDNDDEDDPPKASSSKKEEESLDCVLEEEEIVKDMDDGAFEMSFSSTDNVIDDHSFERKTKRRRTIEPPLPPCKEYDDDFFIADADDNANNLELDPEPPEKNTSIDERDGEGDKTLKTTRLIRLQMKRKKQRTIQRIRKSWMPTNALIC